MHEENLPGKGVLQRMECTTASTPFCFCMPDTKNSQYLKEREHSNAYLETLLFLQSIVSNHANEEGGVKLTRLAIAVKPQLASS